jgi:RNA-directed DNA polymerase
MLTRLRRWRKAGGLRPEGAVAAVERGTPPGGRIRVLRSHVYLHEVVELWVEKRIRTQLEGEAYGVR